MTKKALLTIIGTTVAATFAYSVSAAELTPEMFAKGMKSIGKFGKDAKPLVDGKTGGDKLSADAAELSKTYAGMVGFWKGRKVDDAAKWSEESSAFAMAVSTAAKAGDWDKVKASMGSMQKNCKNCHDAHREKEGDTYKIK